MVISLLYHSWALWWQGYPARAAADMEAGLRLAERLNHPYTYAAAAFLAATLHQLTRRWPECSAQVALASDLAAQGRFALWQAGCAMLRGSVLAHQGRWDEGIAVLQQGLAGWEATGSRLALACIRARLAEAYLLARRQTEGLEALDASLCMVEEGYWLPEQHRLCGELLLLTPGNEAEAEASFRKALEVARSQGAKSFELRAAMSLARFLQRHGRTAEGRELLAQCYGWFTEGFDTPDLLDARDLLGQLD
jgi:predicted ATPase